MCALPHKDNYIYVKTHSANVLTQLRSMIFGLNKYHSNDEFDIGFGIQSTLIKYILLNFECIE